MGNFIQIKQNEKLGNMEWTTAQSLDFNPVELVCDELDRRVKAKLPTSDTHFWELLQQNWEDVPGKYLILEKKEVCSHVKSAKDGYLE